MRKIVFALLLTMGKVCCLAQQLQCTVLEKDTHHPLDGMVVRAFAADGTMLSYTSSDEKGQFTLDLSKSPKTIKVAGLGYTTLSVTVLTLKNYPKIYLSTSATKLREVVVKSNRLQERGDTLAYSVAGFAQKQDRSIADVLKKMPGIEVKENGTIEYNGTAINKFYIEGMDLMNNRYALASNNLDRKKVKTVQVLRHHQPIAALRGKTFSERAAINLVLTDNAKLNMISAAAMERERKKCCIMNDSSQCCSKSGLRTSPCTRATTRVRTS